MRLRFDLSLFLMSFFFSSFQVKSTRLIAGKGTLQTQDVSDARPIDSMGNSRNILLSQHIIIHHGGRRATPAREKKL